MDDRGAPAAVAWVIVCVAACGGSTPRASTLQLHARTHGSTLELELRNMGAQPIDMPTGLHGRITVSLARSDESHLVYVFRAPTEQSMDRAIETGAKHIESIDLVSAALRDHAEPPPPGDYTLSVGWSDGGPQLTATTKLTIAAPTDQPCASAPTSNGIELLARQVDTTSVVEVGLHNVSDSSICVTTRIDAGFPQNDWLAIELGATYPAFHFVAVRHAAVAVTTELPAGATAWSRWDLNEWTARLALPPLARGHYAATATWDSTRETTAYHGALSAHFVMTMR